MRISGAEFKEWYYNHWPHENYFLEDCKIQLHDDNDEWIIADDAVLDTDDLGYLVWDSLTMPKPAIENNSVTSFIHRWRTTRDYDILVFKVKKSLADKITNMVRDELSSGSYLG